MGNKKSDFEPVRLPCYLEQELDEEDELEEMLRRNHRERVLLTVVALLMIAGASFLYLTSP